MTGGNWKVRNWWANSVKYLPHIGFKSYRWWLKFFVFSCFLIFCVGIQYIFIFHPLIGKKWIRKIKNERPQILQVVETSLLEMNMDIKILKKRYRGSIYLEFLSKTDGSFRLINSVDLPGRYNGFLEYQKGTISLGTIDQNGDGRLEIIAPTFDKFLRPHFNIVFYHPELHKFKLHPEANPVRFQ